MFKNQSESGTRHKIINSRPVSSRSIATTTSKTVPSNYNDTHNFPGSSKKGLNNTVDFREKSKPIKTHDELYQDYVKSRRSTSTDRPDTSQVAQQVESMQKTQDKSHDSRLISAYRRYINQAYYRNTDYLNQPNKTGTSQNRFFAGLRTSPLHFEYSTTKLSKPCEVQLKQLLVTSKAAINVRDHRVHKKRPRLSNNTKRIRTILGATKQSFMTSSNKRKRKIVLNTMVANNRAKNNKPRLYPVDDSTKLFTKKKSKKNANSDRQQWDARSNSILKEKFGLQSNHNTKTEANRRLMDNLFHKSGNFSFEMQPWHNTTNVDTSKTMNRKILAQSNLHDKDHDVIRKPYIEEQPMKMLIPDFNATLGSSSFLNSTTVNSSFRPRLDMSQDTNLNNTGLSASVDCRTDGEVPSFLVAGFEDYSFGRTDDSTRETLDESTKASIALRPDYQNSRSKTSLSSRISTKVTRDSRAKSSLNGKRSTKTEYTTPPKTIKPRPLSACDTKPKRVVPEAKATLSKSKSPVQKDAKKDDRKSTMSRASNKSNDMAKTPRDSRSPPKHYTEFNKDGRKKVVTFSKMSKSQPDYTHLRNEDGNVQHRRENLSKSYDDIELNRTIEREKPVSKRPKTTANTKYGKIHNTLIEKKRRNGESMESMDASCLKTASTINVPMENVVSSNGIVQQLTGSQLSVKSVTGSSKYVNRAHDGKIVDDIGRHVNSQSTSLNIDSKMEQKCGLPKAKRNFGLLFSSVEGTERLTGCFGMSGKMRMSFRKDRFVVDLRTKWNQLQSNVRNAFVENKSNKNQIEPYDHGHAKSKVIVDEEAQAQTEFASDKDAVIERQPRTCHWLTTWFTTANRNRTINAAIERIMDRHKNMTKQRKRQLCVLLFLVIFLLITLIIALVLAIEVPKTELHGLTIDSFMLSPKNGSFGDFCDIDVNNCGKFMECKNNSLTNMSSCVCSSGYTVGPNWLCFGLVDSPCTNTTDCQKHSICLENKCTCKSGYHVQEANQTCFAKYNSTCEHDEDCLKNGECQAGVDLVKRCTCTTRLRSVYSPNSTYYRQCRLLVGTACTENEDCLDNARCKKYCSCRDFEVYFETNAYFCEDGCKNISQTHNSNGTAIKFPHPSRCGMYFTCGPRELDLCTSNYTFNPILQSCDANLLC